MTKGVHFAVSNSGTVSAVNVEAHLVIPRNLGLVIATNDQVHPSTNTGVDELLGKLEKGFPFQTKPGCWEIKLSFERILPGHVIFSPDIYYIGATQSGRWQMKGTIYGDNLSKPNESLLEITINTRS
jgi:hypothetical protein